MPRCSICERYIMKTLWVCIMSIESFILYKNLKTSVPYRAFPPLAVKVRGFHLVAQAGFEDSVLLPQLPKCWGNGLSHGALL